MERVIRSILDNVLSGMKAGFKSILNLEHLFERNKMDNQTSRSTIVIFCKKTLLLISSVLLSYGMVVTPVLAKEMTFWSRDTNAKQLRALVDGWNKTHETQVKLNVIPAGKILAKLGIAMAADTPPDIAAIDSTRIVKFVADGQLLLDITDKAQALPYYDHFIKGFIDTATYPKIGGRLYAIPFFLDAMVLIYNKDLFRRAGIDPENPPLSNRAELQEAIEKVTALGDDIYGFYFSGQCSGCMIFTSAPHVWASGGHIFNEDASAATLDDSEVHALLKFYHWMITSGQVPPSAAADNGANFIATFMSGKIGMQGVSSTGLSLVINDAPEIDFGVAYAPGRLGGKSSWIGGDSIAIPKGGKYPDEAWAFIEWMTSEEVQLKYYAELNYTPIRTDLYDPEKVPFFKADPRAEKAARAVEFGTSPWAVEMEAVFCCAPTSPVMDFWMGAIIDGDFDFEDAQKRANKIISKGQ